MPVHGQHPVSSAPRNQGWPEPHRRSPLSIDPVLSRVAPYTCYAEQVRLLPNTIRHKRPPPRGTKERQAPKPELQIRLYGTDPLIF